MRRNSEIWLGKEGRRRRRKKQDDGENEKQLKNFARGSRRLLEVQSNFAEVEPLEKDEGVKKGPGGNQQHFKFHTTASQGRGGLKVPF